MDIYDYIKLDHKKVALLFKQFEKSELIERRKQIVAVIVQELIIHLKSEQETFYRALKQFKSTTDEAVHGKKEHSEIENQINLITQSKEYDSSWDKQVKQLKSLVEHHVNEEERSMFKHAKNVLMDEDEMMLKERMHYLKQHILLELQEKEVS